MQITHLTRSTSSQSPCMTVLAALLWVNASQCGVRTIPPCQCLRTWHARLCICETLETDQTVNNRKVCALFAKCLCTGQIQSSIRIGGVTFCCPSTSQAARQGSTENGSETHSRA
eukprot:820153-Amphidinium_carterae.1